LRRSPSPFARGRGLKLRLDCESEGVDGLPFARGRGLKLRPMPHPMDELEVALRARAWIETLGPADDVRAGEVALRARAWIETATTADR